MHRILIAVSMALSFATAAPALAAGTDMRTRGPHAAPASAGYRFDLACPPQTAGTGQSIISVTLMHDGGPVTGAIIVQSRADMGPVGMAGMTAPIKPLGEQPPGTYRFEVENGSVWKKADDWSLSFSAKVQGVAQTVSGSVTVKLMP